MGNGSIIEIILLAAVAAFLVFRLRSILGRRTGHQEPSQPRTRRANGEAEDGDNIISLPGRRSPQADAETGLDSALKKIHQADPDFNPNEFINGAKAAFAMIVDGFSKGDTAALRPLLGDDLYDDFSNAIRNRSSTGERLESEIIEIRNAQITEAEMEGRKAVLTVRFTSKQKNVTRDGDGTVIDGDPDKAETVIDIWTFMRNTRSKDPTWGLVRTAVPASEESDTDEDGKGNG